MSVGLKVTILTVLLSVCAVSAYAVPPAYQGPLGNNEEPALRPYKWLWRGIQAFTYQPVVALKEGNIKSGAIGSLGALRGVRKGSVELAESAFKGMIGTPPPPKNDYKKEGKGNTFINNEPALSTLSDGVIPKIIDTHPLNDEAKQQELRDKTEKAKQARAEANKKCQEDKKSPQDRRSERIKAQERYIGERAKINTKDHVVKNYLKEFRK